MTVLSILRYFMNPVSVVCHRQLMQHVTLPPGLTCDPARLLDEFPKWLERVSSKVPGGVVVVLDSIDRFQVR